ncbi:hypothetical protein CDAR_72821 [Caerostris darwini]|uniref:Uncharacterized protein n=1 Tax=Caerostris darwini TaxID=1538125 RepID=A0AAV4MM83_9ARAC|nr:hypothetical protein CDAR_72821 [Caerostris darwini]
MRHCGLLSSTPGGYGPPCLENLAPGPPPLFLGENRESGRGGIAEKQLTYFTGLPNDLKIEAHRWLISGSSGLEVELESDVAVVQLFRFRTALIGRSE